MPSTLCVQAQLSIRYYFYTGIQRKHESAILDQHSLMGNVLGCFTTLPLQLELEITDLRTIYPQKSWIISNLVMDFNMYHSNCYCVCGVTLLLLSLCSWWIGSIFFCQIQIVLRQLEKLQKPRVWKSNIFTQCHFDIFTLTWHICEQT